MSPGSGVPLDSPSPGLSPEGEFATLRGETCRQTDLVFSRYPVLNIHPTIARQMRKKASVAPRLIADADVGGAVEGSSGSR